MRNEQLRCDVVRAAWRSSKQCHVPLRLVLYLPAFDEFKKGQRSDMLRMRQACIDQLMVMHQRTLAVCRGMKTPRCLASGALNISFLFDANLSQVFSEQKQKVMKPFWDPRRSHKFFWNAKRIQPFVDTKTIFAISLVSGSLLLQFPCVWRSFRTNFPCVWCSSAPLPLCLALIGD